MVVSPEAPATFEVSIKNDSTIVDAYEIQLADPPSWLTLVHGESNLLPATVRTVLITLAVRPGAVAIAQRVTMPIVVRSSVDPTQATPLEIVVVVPRSGPQAVVSTHPQVIRLSDVTEGTFTLLLDNRAANFARRYHLSASDPEDVVRVGFVPSAVDLPAGGSAEAAVRFTAPAPPPGKEVSRQLTITATDPEGSVPVTVTIAQSTAAAPDSLPVRVRLEPAAPALVDTGVTAVNVVLDNRGGRSLVKFNLSGRDPGGKVRFQFDHTRVAVQAGTLGYVRVVVETSLPPRGASESRPFSVTALSDDGHEAEATGTLELSSRPDAITTAALHIHPEHLATKGRKGSYTVDLDNRRGAEPLHVQLSGADEYGTARLAFQPAVLLVPPGQTARAGLVVQNARPAAGATESRRVQVRATSATGSVTAEATFTQHAENLRRLWAVLTVLLGVCVLLPGVILWAMAPELSNDTIESAVNQVADAANTGQMPDPTAVGTTAAAALLLLLMLCGGLMLLGLTGGGRMVRAAAIVAAVCGVGVLAASGLAIGLPFVVGGAVLAFAGGVMLRR
ncbi:hypothetical protein ASD81_01880 [Nocardioides sp. Root614]|nr:hypothetical protein ASD81_01880 [Nocardioides sp. Root614]KRA91451.1 hypothetical protein ASD84_02145 [Nocardioides sp. Root682]